VDVLMTGDGSVSDVRIHPPQDLCPNRPKADEPCEPGSYEGAPVVPSPEVVQVAEPFVREAAAKKNELVGITVAEPFPQDGTRESALGNLLADLILEARPGADLAIMNGGGIRAPLPKGELRYQGFFEVFPFDNRFARVRVSAGDLARVFENNVSQDRSILSVSGIRVRARCEGEKVAVDLLDGRGRVISPSRKLTVITSDFIATGGDGGLGGEVTLEDGEPMREALLDRLRERAAPLRPDDPRLLDPKRPRFDVAQRPLPCSASHP
ncbi:MAG: 5'-nucleotidase C-terminal domain-containing protein, partial [Myxococcales bacterium]|nr:5'-nucleotidase C-terminal domain-containing protein [Myxococcales bacterium]